MTTAIIIMLILAVVGGFFFIRYLQEKEITTTNENTALKGEVIEKDVNLSAQKDIASNDKEFEKEVKKPKKKLSEYNRKQAGK